MRDMRRAGHEASDRKSSSKYKRTREVRVSAHRHFVFLQNFEKSSLGRIFAKDLRFCEQLLRKIKVNTIAEERRT